jgi:L-fuconolactonase
MVIDAQVHVVSPDHDRYPLDPTRSGGPGWFDLYGRSVEELLAEMDAVGIDRTVLVQAYSAYRFDSRYTADSAALSPRFVCTCAVNFEGDTTKEARYWVSERSARGIRLFLNVAPPDWLDSPACDTLLDELEALGAVAQVLGRAENLPGLLRAARRHPGLAMLVDHCAYPDLSGGAGYPNATGLFALADAGNVHIKLSTQVFGLARDAGVPLPALATDLVGAFGAGRVMWASDLTTQPRSYADVLGDATEACADLTGEDRALVMGGSAAAMWWPEP